MTDKLKDQTSGMPAATDDTKKIAIKKPGGKAQVIINPPEKVQRDANESFRQALEKHTVMLEKKIELVLQGKAKRSELPEETLRQVFIRGYKSLPLNTELTREQYAMNRVNSFMAGGAAMKEDFDLIPIMERLGMKGTGGARRPHIKREKSPYNGRTIFHVVDAKGHVKHSTADEGEAKQHLATKYNSYMESTLSPMKRFEGTKSLVKTYKDDTPGEKLKEGRMSDLDLDLKDMKDKDFETHYGKPKAEYTPKKKPAPVKKPANVKEDVQSIEELKSSTLTSYIDRVASGPSRGTTQTGVLKSIKAIGGVTKAIRKRTENSMKEETDLQELSKDTLNSYMWSAKNDNSKTDAKISKALDKNREDFSAKRHSNITKMLDKSIKRSGNIIKATNKIMAKEETLNELSPGTLHSYATAGHKKYGEIEHKTDAASTTKKSKLVAGVKKAMGKMYPKPKPKTEPKHDSSPGGYYASKKPGEYTGD